ncbi:D-3-phosphoglycerate dehydrogenase [Cupriavidus sp. USMAHM13]|uniref:D-3-phosphoglycerate dehydrogenase n=1 Tax=Cupriavidus malaysiensis TaxID=367825 RepID=A0ABN4TQG8_9BURK|nr:MULTISPECIES: phosphoglycerate dehydrogenase [Cupriavidus]AOZ03054.1 D-3-phosphoglycerate dehydrogenase [Cupriavidus sp. USMAHM13]AOZ09582.1 D-3-phosphoglycerate dehydrogenase [Cupriavidus malaysiensis]
MTTAMLLENIHQSATAPLQGAGISVDRRTGALAGDELRQVLAAHDLVGIRSATHLRAADIASAPQLLSIGCFCIGTSQVDLEAAAAAGIPVFNAPFSNTRSVAELVIAEAVMLLRRIPEKSALAHAGKWAKGASGAFEARGKTIAIVGYGNIGSQVGVLAEAMGMQVVYFDVLARLSLGSARACATLEEAVGQADVVTLHVPATPRTRNLVDARVLAACKPGAILINASRGTVVDIAALAAALREKRLGGAAIDVFPEEPKTNSEPFVSELQGLPNVLLTPHVGGSTEEAQENIGTEVAAKLVHFLTTGGTIGAVNFPEVDPGPLQAPARLLNVHSNAPGALAALNTLLAQDGANITGQHLQTRGATGYVVTDLDRVPSAGLMEALRAHAGFVRSRLLTR